MRVLIAGVSTRGFAESATRAGYEVVAVDGFGDLDLRARARTVTLARGQGGRFSIRAALAAARAVRRDITCYVASFENHPAAVEALAGGSPPCGNASAVLARVRDPQQLARALSARGIAAPAIRLTQPRGGGVDGRRWLLKPRASGGGAGIVAWRGGRIPTGRYLQERVVGVPGSVVFAADGRRAVPLGVSRGLAGDRAFGATGFKYCGSILLDPEEPLFGYARGLAEAVTADFGLVGVNGIDFVAAHGIPYAVEINPRYTASMELVERAYGISIFETHVRACAGALPELPTPGRQMGTWGKAILYARRRVIPSDTESWLEDPDVRDVPAAHEPIAPGHPICTIFVREQDPDRCLVDLARRASRLFRALEHGEARIA
ncbi:MAG TPA: ATP-grasp domain-containing protein [Gemmatimonadales bacterium]|nr:ATP-grasp domain-containing protein [Gemmatimonadales bacterium]